MARLAGEILKTRPMANRVGCFAEVNAAAWAERAIARNRSAGSLEQNRRRLYRRAFGPSCFARWNSLCARAATGFALRIRAGVEDRDLAKIEATFRRQSHSRRTLSCRLNSD